MSEQAKCDACEGTGWTGDNGPGIEGNSEFYRCDCGGDGKCRIGWHSYRLISGVAWCDKCNREADLDVCKLTHPITTDCGDRPRGRKGGGVNDKTKTPETDRAWADCGNTDPLTAAQRMRVHAWRLESERDEYKASADLARRAADVANFEACKALFNSVTLRYRLRRMVRIALRYRRERDFARMEANWAARREHRAERQRIEMRGKLAECQGQLYRGRKVEG